MNHLCNALEAVAVQRFPNRRMPLHEKVLYALAPVCVLVAIAFNQYGV
jgi:hypothetical protein